jgi:outer membrane immunogenic protein
VGCGFAARAKRCCTGDLCAGSAARLQLDRLLCRCECRRQLRHCEFNGHFYGWCARWRIVDGIGDANGAVAGGQVGFNYQIDAFVLGMEGDFDWSGVSSTAVAGCGVGCTVTGKSNVPWIATIRGRAGVALDRVLLYGTGGAAFTDLSQNITATGFGTLFNASSTEVGWTIGAGVEAAIAQNWTVKAEYLYVQTDATLSGPVSLIGGTLSDRGTVKDNIIRGGLNFKYP